MAQKSLKTLAARNTNRLNITHIIALALHGSYIFLRFVLRLPTSLTTYLLLSLPSLLLELYLERLGRPTYRTDGAGRKELVRAGEDLDAKGLTEGMWDIVYWSWICLVCVILFGDKAWWAMVAIPLYAGYKAVSLFLSYRSAMSGGGVPTDATGASTGATSKRQQKMEKRGGQRTVYR